MKQLRHILLLINAILGFLLPRLEAAPALHRLDLASLSNNAIICLHQDPTGYIWVGTYDGLNLFNGQDTYTYRFEQDYKLSLCSNIILYIADAEPGFLWISTSLGFNKFSTKERKVTAAFPGYINCTLLATNSEGTMVAISRENQIACYLPELNTVCDVPLGDQPQRSDKVDPFGAQLLWHTVAFGRHAEDHACLQRRKDRFTRRASLFSFSGDSFRRF